MIWLPLTPVAEITGEGEELHCAECNRVFGEDEEAVFWEPEYRCEGCSEELAEIIKAEASEFAKANFKITTPLPRYNPAREFRCTPEEYELGLRESYSRNSHLCHCRHKCTNYDGLIENLSKHSHSIKQQIFYEAIRSRADELLAERIEEDGDDFDDELVEV